MARDWGDQWQEVWLLLGHGSLEGPSTWLSPPHLSRHAASPETRELKCSQDQQGHSAHLSISQPPADTETQERTGRGLQIGQPLADPKMQEGTPTEVSKLLQPSSARIINPKSNLQTLYQHQAAHQARQGLMTQAMLLEQRFLFDQWC